MERGGGAGSPVDLLALGPDRFALLRGFWEAHRADCDPEKRGEAG